MRIGIDVGGVIIGGGTGKDTQFFTDTFLTTPSIDLALECLIELRWLGHSLHVISTAGPITQRKTLSWLDEHGYFSIYALWKNNVDFCRKWSDKLAIAKRIGIDVMIDDRLDVCELMTSAGIHAILFSDWNDALKRIDELSLD